MSTTPPPLYHCWKKVRRVWAAAPRNPIPTGNVLRDSDRRFRQFIRYFTAATSAFLPGINSVFDDNIVDGITYNIQVFRGQSRNAELDVNEFGFFRRGDRVKVKLANIDKATYDFWRTWEQNQQNTGNPFGVPIKVLSNISNNALGIWAGYATRLTPLVFPVTAVFHFPVFRWFRSTTPAEGPSLQIWIFKNIALWK